MNETTRKKWYLWQLAHFLHGHQMKMSGEELADHLNRNGFTTSYGKPYSGKRGTYTLITAAWKWVHDELSLKQEAEAIAFAFTKPDGSPAWRPTALTTKEAVYDSLRDWGYEHKVDDPNGSYAYLFDPEEQSVKGKSCAILYRYSFSKAPVHLHLKRISGDWLELLRPFLRPDPSHSPDKHGWNHYEVTDWAGLAHTLEL